MNDGRAAVRCHIENVRLAWVERGCRRAWQGRPSRRAELRGNRWHGGGHDSSHNCLQRSQRRLAHVNANYIAAPSTEEAYAVGV